MDDKVCTRVVTGYVAFGVGAGATATGLSFLEAAPGPGSAAHGILTFLVGYTPPCLRK